MLKIVFDNIVFSLQKAGGISVLWYELLKRILNEDNLDSCFIEFTPVDNFFRSLLKIPSCKMRLNYRFSLKYRRYLPVFYRCNEKFIFHSSYFRICSDPNAINITTVHDFTYEYFYHGLMKKIHCWQKYYAINKSRYIVCISENTKKDLLKFLPHINEDKIRVIYNGVSDDYQPLSYEKKMDTPFPLKSYLLFVGERGGYKNFDFIVRCLKNIDYNLVIVGKKLTSAEQNFLDHHISPKRYYYAGHISNHRLNILYNCAAALVYPSAYEGFGIPVLEAQKAGCPVIAYNKSSIPEIIGKTPLLMEELSVDEFYSKLCLLSNQSLMQTVVANGIRNANRFSWDRMYQQLLKLYFEAISE